MKGLRYLITVAALVFTLPAQAATTDPEVVLYRAAGVADNGSNAATVFSCTPFSGVSENIRVVVRAQNTTLLVNSVTTAPHLSTLNLVTTSGDTLFAGPVLSTGVILGGTVAIAATSTSVTCTAMIIQSNITAPAGIQLHMTRFNPLAGTEE